MAIETLKLPDAQAAWWLSGTGPVTVVLEGGLGASSLGWSRVAAELSEVASVLRYDRPGLGSSRPSAHLDRGLDTLADELLHVIDDASVTRPVVLVGHSWGASIVRLAAQRRPDLIAGLVLLEPVPDRALLTWGPVTRPAGTVIYLAMERAARIGLVRLLARTRLARRWFTGRRGELPDAVRTELLAEVCRASHHVAGHREFVDMVTGSREEVAALAPARPAPYPVLVVSSGVSSRRSRLARTRLTGAHARLARAYGGDHVVLAGAGHLLPREHPVEVADLVARLCQPSVARARVELVSA